MRRLRAAALGVRATLRTPYWSGGHRLRRLVDEPHDPPPLLSGSPASSEARVAVNAAHSALARLARLPASPWRNTCLHRCVAATLALRASGLPARLRIGVERREAGESVHGIRAHAWVEGAGGIPLPDRPGQYSPLQRVAPP